MSVRSVLTFHNYIVCREKHKEACSSVEKGPSSRNTGGPVSKEQL